MVNNEMSDPPSSADERDREYYQQMLREGYRSLLGIVIALVLAELILFIGHVDGNPPLIFAVIGLVYGLRHLAQIWHARTQLKQHTE